MSNAKKEKEEESTSEEVKLTKKGESGAEVGMYTESEQKELKEAAKEKKE